MNIQGKEHGLDLATLMDKKISGFSGYVVDSKISTLESGFKSIWIRVDHGALILRPCH